MKKNLLISFAPFQHFFHHFGRFKQPESVIIVYIAVQSFKPFYLTYKSLVLHVALLQSIFVLLCMWRTIEFKIFEVANVSVLTLRLYHGSSVFSIIFDHIWGETAFIEILESTTESISDQTFRLDLCAKYC